MGLQPGSMPSIFRKDCGSRRHAAQPRTEWGQASSSLRRSAPARAKTPNRYIPVSRGLLFRGGSFSQNELRRTSWPGATRASSPLANMSSADGERATV